MSVDGKSDTFVCPECRVEIPVTTLKSEALEECGCAVCGADFGEGS